MTKNKKASIRSRYPKPPRGVDQEKSHTPHRPVAERERQRAIEAREHEVLRKHRKRLARQARALIAEQRRP